jgi:hypothetical protein
MKIRTAGDLATFLSDELGWRRKELFVYRSLLTNADGSKKQALLRGAIALLYAHWEGFVKVAAEAYIGFVNLRRLKLGELAANFVALAAKGKMTSAAESKKPRVHREFIEWLTHEWTARARLPSDAVVTTGNLSSNVFKAIVDLIGLEYRADFALAETGIIDRLVTLRNAVAHGEWEMVSERDFEELYLRIDGLLSMISNDIELAAIQNIYLRAEPWSFDSEGPPVA